MGQRPTLAAKPPTWRGAPPLAAEAALLGAERRHLRRSRATRRGAPPLAAKPRYSARSAATCGGSRTTQRGAPHNAQEALKGFGQHDVAKPSPKRGMDAAQIKDGGGKQEFSPVFFCRWQKKTYYYRSFQYSLAYLLRYCLGVIPVCDRKILQKYADELKPHSSATASTVILLSRRSCIERSTRYFSR